ncbi:MAG TPA: dihydrodipicolinate synthase family protein [Gemmatimonadaceae bacterium]|nr:dihydrodipicolinate synthase family protein [Gemmatimonadaceae bacterium]
MAVRQFHGVFGPVTTPFAANGDVDVAAFSQNLQAHIAAGLDGVVVNGSTGEAALLDEAERDRLLEAGRQAIGPSKILIAGTGAESARLTSERCRRAAALGADAVLVVAPHYYGDKMSAAALKAHYERVADESPIPVLLYNIPKYMHFRLEPELVEQLAGHVNIVGMKDSAGDVECLSRYMQAQDATFSVLTGHGGTWQQALALGVRGGILAVALFAVELTLAIREAMQQGKPNEAVELQERLTPLALQIVGKMGVAGVKAAMDAVGLRGGLTRLPLLPLGAIEAERVRQMLSQAAAGQTATASR